MGKLEQIKIEFPFDDEFVKGYVSINREKRKIIQMVNKDFSKRKTISYARYRLSVLNKRFLLEDEEADHIDSDETNDSDDNLQILSRAENLLKQSLLQKKGLVICQCPNCDISFGMIPSEYNNRLKLTKSQICCSRKCASSWNIKLGLSPSISDSDKHKVPTSELMKVFELIKLGKSRKEISSLLELPMGATKHRIKLVKDRQIDW